MFIVLGLMLSLVGSAYAISDDKCYNVAVNIDNAVQQKVEKVGTLSFTDFLGEIYIADYFIDTKGLVDFRYVFATGVYGRNGPITYYFNNDGGAYISYPDKYASEINPDLDYKCNSLEY